MPNRLRTGLNDPIGNGVKDVEYGEGRGLNLERAKKYEPGIKRWNRLEISKGVGYGFEFYKLAAKISCKSDAAVVAKR